MSPYTLCYKLSSFFLHFWLFSIINNVIVRLIDTTCCLCEMTVSNNGKKYDS